MPATLPPPKASLTNAEARRIAPDVPASLLVESATRRGALRPEAYCTLA